MASSFCTSCGFKMTYSFSPPNFCGKCGTKLSTSFSSASSPTQAKARNREDEEEFEDEDDEETSSSEEVPFIKSFAYDLENDSGNRQYQLGELFGQPKTFARRNRSMSVDDFKERHGKKE